MGTVRHKSVAECDDRCNGLVVEAKPSHLPVRYQVEYCTRSRCARSLGDNERSC